jgi:hypothetical protein
MGGSLLEHGRLETLQALLQRLAPAWSRGLHVRRPRRDREIIDLSIPGALAGAVRARAAERGVVFQQLADEEEAQPSSRVFGQAELAGADPSLIVVVSIDSQVLARAGVKWIWGNRITFQVGRSRVDGIPAAEWTRRAFEALCVGLSPQHGHAEMFEEYEAKNISHDDGGTQAVGVDVSRYLPGLYWLNFLGRAYCELIGTERVLTTPCPEVRPVDQGVLIALSTDPATWVTAEYGNVEARAREHLGQQYFFSGDDPERNTVSPGFPLS